MIVSENVQHLEETYERVVEANQYNSQAVSVNEQIIENVSQSLERDIDVKLDEMQGSAEDLLCRLQEVFHVLSVVAADDENLAEQLASAHPLGT